MWLNDFLSVIRRGAPVDGRLYLTFDDGPDPVFTPRLLDLLAEHQVRATFFVVGQAAKKHPRLIRRTVAEGHAVGCHTYSHCHPWWMSAARARAEVSRGYHAIRRAATYRPAAFRPPHGRVRPAMLAQARELGMTTVLWNRSAMDWGRFGGAAGIARRLEKTAAGDIVLLHDGRPLENRPVEMLQAVGDLIERCADRGLHFDVIDNLIETKKLHSSSLLRRSGAQP